jgi:hypothetical protein
MAKTDLAAAQVGADNRRGHAGPWGAPPTFNLNIGLKIGYSGGKVAREGQNTVSVALTRTAGDCIAYYVSQDGNSVKPPGLLANGEWQWENVFTKKTPGLHAEMALIRYLFKQNLLHPGAEQQDAAAIDLVIVCLNANVCSDCSGWMHAHGIPHCPALAAPNTSMTWIHPRTGAAYRGGGNLSYYAKMVPIPGDTDYRIFGTAQGTVGPIRRV